MRMLAPLAALAALAFAQSAAAATITVNPVTFAPELQTKFEEDFGVREQEYLTRRVSSALERTLTRAGAELAPGGELVLDVTLIDAKPNRPTFQQLADRPGLDMGRSASIGGAELHGVLRTSSGEVLAEFDHDYRTPTIEDAYHTGAPWFDAYRAIDGFAAEAADAYEAHAR